MTDREALTTTREMLSAGTDLDVIASLLSDHYGIEILILPKGMDRLAVVTLANAVHDADTTLTLVPATLRAGASRRLARFVLDLFAAQPEPIEPAR